MLTDLPDGLHLQAAHLLGELAERGFPAAILVRMESGQWKYFHNVESDQQCEHLLEEGTGKVLDSLAAGIAERRELSSRVN